MAYPDHEPTSGDTQRSQDGSGSRLGDANKAWEDSFDEGSETTDDVGYETTGDVSFPETSGVVHSSDIDADHVWAPDDNVDEVEASGWDSVVQPGAPASPASADAEDVKDQAKEVLSDAGQRAGDVADTAQREAGEVKDAALSAASDVADSVTEQAGNVAEEVGHQSRRLMDEGMSELRTQAGAGQQRLAELSRALGGELQAMTRSSDQSGPITDLASNAQHLFDDAANWLERSEPSDVLDSVRRYASRNPWTFLAISAGVGFVGARIVRGLQSKDRATQPAPALDVPSGSHGAQTEVLAPTEDPTYAGGARYGSQDRVQPSETPGTHVPPVTGSGFDTQQAWPPDAAPHGGMRGL